MSGSLPEPEHDKTPASDRGPRLRLLAEGIACLNAKQFERAQQLAGQAASIDVRDPDAWHLLGIALAGQGQHARAADAIARAIALNPMSAQFHANLGNTQFQQADYAKAIESYSRAVELDRSYESTQELLAKACERQLDLGIEHHRGNRFAEAKACYESVLRGQPKRADALHLLGMLAYERRDYATATALLTEAIAVNPSVSAFRASMGAVQRAQGHHAQALAAYKMALELEPNSALNLYYVGLCQYALRHYSAAQQAVTSSIALDARIAASHNLLGQIHRSLGRSSEAIASFRRGLELEPDNAALHSNLLFSLNYRHDVSPASVFSAHVGWAARHGRGEQVRMVARSQSLETARVLRIGYVSADLRSHSVAYFLEPVLEARDRNAVHVTFYANRIGRDATTNRLRALSDEWRVIDGMNDDDALALIRNDEIDILVDLSGHTGRNRMPLFARRAAPIQVTYIGYPNTTGLATMDYRLTDAWADPVGLTERLNTEELVRLDGGYLCYRPPVDSPPVGEPPVLANGHITFGSFNNLAKVNPALIARWAAILNGVPGSRMMLKTKPLADAGARDLLLSSFARYGIAPDRLVLSGWADDTAGHLARYSDIDIALDTFPYHGTTTTCEALWMGVPVVTCAGEIHASRVGVSLLSGIGLDELIASSMEGYVETAISLAHDVSRLRRLRAALRARMTSSPITDKARIARAVETAYRTMWRRLVEQTLSASIEFG
jgi:protein O-GlcNAc transferase